MVEPADEDSQYVGRKRCSVGRALEDLLLVGSGRRGGDSWLWLSARRITSCGRVAGRASSAMLARL